MDVQQGKRPETVLGLFQCLQHSKDRAKELVGTRCPETGRVGRRGLVETHIRSKGSQERGCIFPGKHWEQEEEELRKES